MSMQPRPPGERTRRAKRRPGRPAARGNGSMSKADVVRCALELSKREPLQNISIVRVAAELNVTPALIHYYIGGRDRLTSGVMNSFYAVLIEQLPQIGSDWRSDINAVFDALYATYICYGGIVAYIMSHNRFRLFQLVEAKEQDFGSTFFERLVASIRLAGLSAQRTAMYAHLLLQHVLSSAYQQASHQLPEDHQEFLVSRMKKLSAKSTPNTHFVLESFSMLRGDDAFRAGLTIIVDAIAREVEQDKGRISEDNPMTRSAPVATRRLTRLSN
jgi:AcrR family transcriptional regulator